MAGEISSWVQKRVEQIQSLSVYDGGGKCKSKIDSNEEFACIGRLLTNCTTEEDKQFINAKMQEYLDASRKEHFENDDGTSYDEVYDKTGNRMYVGYDKKGNLDHISTTYVDENGVEHPKNKENPIKFGLSEDM